MAVEGIKISMGQVTSTAGRVRSLNQDLSQRLEDIKKQMNELSQAWQSDASDTIRANFNALAPRFQHYHEVVNSYAQFLDTTVTSYEETESKINSFASEFK